LQDEPVETPRKNEFVPLWMPVLAFILIVMAYMYCDVNGIHVNPYYQTGAIGISGLFAAICVYLKIK
jgi:hypothetical protein